MGRFADTIKKPNLETSLRSARPPKSYTEVLRYSQSGHNRPEQTEKEGIRDQWSPSARAPPQRPLVLLYPTNGEYWVNRP